MNKKETGELAEKAKSGDRSAFETLYSEFRDRVFFFAKRTVGSEAAAEDITSETFVTALEKIGTLREGESFIGWLYSIAYHLCQRYLGEGSRSAPLDEERYTLSESVMLPEDYAVNENTPSAVLRM